MQCRWILFANPCKSLSHRKSVLFAVFFFFIACSLPSHGQSPDSRAVATADMLADAEDHSEIFHSVDRWISVDGTPVKSGWSFRDGIIHLSQKGENKENIPGGHIITKVEYQDFDIEFDWKIARNGNSGLKYMVQRYGGRYLGIEYQLYDDEGTNKVEAKNSTGSLYDLFAPRPEKSLRPAGEWNRSRIVVQGGRIQHWLNDALIVDVSMDDKEWGEQVAASKFQDVPDFCKSRRGRLMLTDHGSDVSYRVIRFKAISTESKR